MRPPRCRACGSRSHNGCCELAVDLFVQVQELHAFSAVSAVTASGPPVATLANSVALRRPHATSLHPPPPPPPRHTSGTIQSPEPRHLAQWQREQARRRQGQGGPADWGHPRRKGLDRDPQVPCSPVIPCPCPARPGEASAGNIILVVPGPGPGPNLI
jgi:hypothetical protein